MSEQPFQARDRYFAAALEDRSAPRTRLAIPAVLRLSGAPGFQTIVHDLSLSGFCAAAISPAAAGTRCWLVISDMEPLGAEVVWWNNNLAGCAFRSLLPPQLHASLVERWQPGNGFWPAC